MGMFDHVRCEYILPEATEEIQKSVFQTKDLENLMDDYTITNTGKLILHSVEWDVVPEEKRPYFGKPEWDSHKGFYKSFGSLCRIPLGDVDTEYHGLISIYTSNKKIWYEYVLRFTDGLLAKVDEVKIQPIKKR